MFDFSNTVLTDIVVHKVGNIQKEEKLQLSKAPLSLDNQVKELLHTYFLSPFKEGPCYHFLADGHIEINIMYNYIKTIFENQSNFLQQSVHIAEHLHNKSTHPKIKEGEFYVVKLSNCLIDDEICDAVGLFKSENKDTFIKVYQRNDNFQLTSDNGVNIKKLDKGCLIFNTEAEQGYKIFIIDNLNKNSEAQFWRDDFLSVEMKNDDYYQTKNYLDVCKGFVREIYNDSNQVEKPDQIDLLNRSVNFFKEKTLFDVADFENEVMGQNEQTQKAFEEYRNEYEKKNQVALTKEFNISNEAVNTNKRYFKSILKLDKNFHVYIHGNRNYIEKGWDDKKKKHYYKLFFEEEN